MKMKRLFLSFCAVMLFTNVLAASSQITISSPQSRIMLVTGQAHVSLVIKVQHHRDNRLLKLDWEWSSAEFQLNNPTAKELEDNKEYGATREGEYFIFTDHDFCKSATGPSGLFLPRGTYLIEATLTRIVDGKYKDFSDKVEVIIGIPEEEEK